ncbi:hypothetical protein [Pseudanabaena yagii]|uniref:AAA+ ATPase domain-containing protein n=1 Tax=Pseudanabaena yagii GIHE-NHR1 TaxID=2722753 RepID=A0ABX1LVW0_9CYAN|nr:hypothetical protein [Pseudanabaena yagii]NMF60307.1 hypothetical protein [Pseudanabaena yagii GIHE-NHR1]
MSDRLKLFRRLISAFEGTSNPQRAVERGFYVNLPDNPVGVITGKIALRPSSVHLLFGGIGSGKTTQLLLTQEALNELEDIKAIYVDISLFTDISELQSGALIAIAGLELIKILQGYNTSELNDSKRIFERLLYGNSEIVTYHQQRLAQGIGAIESILKTGNSQSFTTTETRENRSSVLQAFIKTSTFVNEKLAKQVVFLFDSLDRLRESKTFVKPVLDDVIEINKHGLGAILVGSIVALYTERVNIAKNTENFYFLPYLDILEDDESRQFFSEIFNVRDPEKLINQEARELLISHSGGVLRDLMSLSQAAIEEAYMDGSDLIMEQHANQAIAAIERSKTIGLADLSIDILVSVMTEKSFSPRTSEDFELMLTGHILEYGYPRQRFAVHPILVPLIENTRRIKRRVNR